MSHQMLVNQLQRQLWAEQSDASLLSAFVERRDHEAFAAIVSRYGPLVWSVCRRQLGDSSAADDATQTAFLMLIQQARRIRPAGLAAWLVCVSRRVCQKIRRAETRRRRREASAAIAESTSAADAELSARELMKLLDDELMNLPSRYRAALLACYWQGLTQAEAAIQLGTTPTTIKGLLERGRAKLLERLRGRGLTADVALKGLLAAPLALAAFSDDLHAQILTSSAAVMPAPVAWLPASTLWRWGIGGLAVITTSVGLMLLPGVTPQEHRDGFPETKKANSASRPFVDVFGDPLPPGVVARLGTSRLRPGGSIGRMAFSPDGKQLASWHENGNVTNGLTIWNVADGRELRRIDRPLVQAIQCQWLADGRGFAVLKVDDEFAIWEFTNDAASPPAATVGGVSSLVTAQFADLEHYSRFGVSPDGQRLVGGRLGMERGTSRNVDVWDLTPGKKLSELPKQKRFAILPDNCSALLFTPDARKLIAICNTRNEKGWPTECLAFVYDSKTGTVLQRFSCGAASGNGDGVGVAASNDRLAIGLADEPCTVVLRNLNSGESQSFTAKHPARPGTGFGVSAITFTTDGRTLVTVGPASDIRIWDVAKLQMTRSIPDPSYSRIESLVVSPDGKTLASAGGDWLIRLWDMATGKEKAVQDEPTGTITGVHITKDARLAATFGADGVLRQWELATGRQTRSVPLANNGRIWRRGEMAPDGHTLLTNAGGRIKAFDLETGSCSELPGLPPDLVSNAIRLGSDGKTLISMTADKISLIDWPEAKVRRTVKLLSPQPNKLGMPPGKAFCISADISPDGAWLTTLGLTRWQREDHGFSYGGTGDPVVDLWDATNGTYVRRVVTCKGMACQLLYTTDGDVLLAGGKDPVNMTTGEVDEFGGPISLIDPLTNRVKRRFSSIPAGQSRFPYVNRMVLSADKRSLFASVEDNILIYEVLTGRLRGSLTGYRGTIMDLAVSHDGRRLVAGGFGMNALVWDVSLASPGSAGPAPTADEQSKLERDLFNLNAASALPSMQRLAANPDIAVAVFRTMLKPATSAPTDELLDRLVSELGSENYRVREAASRQLGEFGEMAAMGLKTRFAKSTDVEVRSRIVKLLDKLNSATPTAEEIAESRAFEILEQINTPDARQLLKDLAGGAPNARRTREAAASLRRIRE
jgi:RNA polymerase sigma factor (sigma-70 family)